MEYTDFLLKFVEQGGPLVGIFLPILEAFIPILPLVGFVIINVGVFGFFWGYIYSWIGSCIGSFLLFLIIKKVEGKRLESKIKESKYKGTLDKIRRKNFSVLFILYCFPFTPSFLISGTSALSNMNTKKFLTALIPAKLIMMISLSFIGVNVKSFLKNPMKSIIFVVIIILFNLLCKKIVDRYEKKHRK
ncbi:putative membrane protein YdjX (TVP38/TMEM64 family) [Sedimentibacter acidaminivorans]|uniref:TVP38/TMEM64 family membrane protein n=1 Tax=Sedimentibacter acidaminivorans TaxID=913099 RepID=A0ABS4GEH7_9FIRM|nr:VTT domain-containing protein [Sedimentibacter acidaminivorans]MBP1926108.1 putative membrane protein YdjX (TVP38/TMEM64 family) [Sedimentibacter acidaminivorans]